MARFLKLVVEPAKQDGFWGKEEQFLDSLVIFNSANKSRTPLYGQLGQQSYLWAKQCKVTFNRTLCIFPHFARFTCSPTLPSVSYFPASGVLVTCLPALRTGYMHGCFPLRKNVRKLRCQFPGISSRRKVLPLCHKFRLCWIEVRVVWRDTNIVAELILMLDEPLAADE